MASRSRTMLASTLANAANLRHASSSVLIPAITAASSSTSRALSSSATQRQQDGKENAFDPLSRPRRDPNRDTAVQSTPKPTPLRDSVSARRPTRPTIRDPRMYIPPTQWQSPKWMFPAPPTETSRLIPLMQDKTNIPNPDSKSPPKRPSLGPGGSNWTNIRYASRALKLRLTKAGRVIGQDGRFRGVIYRRLPMVDDVSARCQHFHRANVQNAHFGKLPDFNFLERAGGDYGHLQPKGRSTMDPYDWRKSVYRAFATNTDIPYSTRIDFEDKITQILEGKPRPEKEPRPLPEGTDGAQKE